MVSMKRLLQDGKTRSEYRPRLSPIAVHYFIDDGRVPSDMTDLASQMAYKKDGNSPFERRKLCLLLLGQLQLEEELQMAIDRRLMCT